MENEHARQLKLVDELSIVMKNLEIKDFEFAKSITNYFVKNKQISQKQEFWVNKLIQKSKIIQNTTSMNENNNIEVGSFSIFEKLMETASKKLKYPAVIINVKEVGNVMVGLPIKKGDPGVEVCIKKQKYNYIGSVIDNKFEPYFKGMYVHTRIIDLLKSLSKDPVNTLIEYGKATCVCCFCGSGLEDEKSINMGYGPVCAKNYGLPWG